MIAIWPSHTGTGDDGMLGATGRDQATSLVALYGPRTTVLVSLDDGVYEFSYGCTPEGCEVCNHCFYSIRDPHSTPQHSSTFAISNGSS